MAQHKTFVNQIIFIPRGSQLDGIVTSTASKIQVSAFLSGPGFNNPPLNSPHPAAFNNHWVNTLAQKGEYAAVLDVDFFTSANSTATSTMAVQTPSGKVFTFPWVVPLSGKIGDSFTMSLSLSVK